MTETVQKQKKKKRPVFTRTIDENGNEYIDAHLLPYQLKAAKSDKKITGILGGRGCGKSIYLSVMTVQEICAGGKVALFAQDKAALRVNLFSEVIKRFYECGLTPTINYSLHTIKFGKGELYGYSYENIDAIRGLSEVSLLVLDELAKAPADLFEVVTPCLRGSARHSRILFATTPKKGTIWNKWMRDESIEKEVITATMYDNTELNEEDIAMQKNAIKDAAAYKQEILGEILEDDVEFGIIKSMDYPIMKKEPFGIHRMGFDASGSGADYNVFVVTDDSSILEIVKEQLADTYKLYNIALDLIKKHNIQVITMDCTGGFSNGLADMLEHNSIKVNRINFAQQAKEKEVYANARSEMFFNLAEKIKNGFYIGDSSIKEELQFMTYTINGSGKTLLCPKKSVKDIIGRSPDISDALALALYEPNVINTISPEESLSIAMRFCGL